MRIDSHQHFWKYNAVNHAWIDDDMKLIRKDFLPGDLAPLLKSNGFDGCVSVQADQHEGENEFLLSLAKENSYIKGIVGWVDLKGDDLNERLEYWKSHALIKGFRHVVQGEPKGFLSDPRFVKGVNALAKFGFTYDLLVYHHQLEEALSFVSKLDDVKIVVDHIAKPSIRTGEKTHWELDMAALSTFKNVSCKISGMVTEANWRSWKKEDFFPYLDEVFESFGADRIMYGSDWPVCLVAAQYEEQLEIVSTYMNALTSHEKEMIMGGNATKFYNL